MPIDRNVWSTRLYGRNIGARNPHKGIREAVNGLSFGR